MNAHEWCTRYSATTGKPRAVLLALAEEAGNDGSILVEETEDHLSCARPECDWIYINAGRRGGTRDGTRVDRSVVDAIDAAARRMKETFGDGGHVVDRWLSELHSETHVSPSGPLGESVNSEGRTNELLATYSLMAKDGAPSVSEEVRRHPRAIHPGFTSEPKGQEGDPL